MGLQQSSLKQMPAKQQKHAVLGLQQIFITLKYQQ